MEYQLSAVCMEGSCHTTKNWLQYVSGYVKRLNLYKKSEKLQWISYKNNVSFQHNFFSLSGHKWFSANTLSTRFHKGLKFERPEADWSRPETTQVNTHYHLPSLHKLHIPESLKPPVLVSIATTVAPPSLDAASSSSMIYWLWLHVLDVLNMFVVIFNNRPHFTPVAKLLFVTFIHIASLLYLHAHFLSAN